MRNGRRRRGGAHRREAISAINMTPFIDVMLVLLIIFMVAMPKIEAPTDVGGGASATEAQAAPGPVTVAMVGADGNVTLKRGPDERPAAYGKIAESMEAFGRPETGKVYVKAEDCASYGRYFRVMSELDKAGLKPILVTSRAGLTGKAAEARPSCPDASRDQGRGD